MAGDDVEHEAGVTGEQGNLGGGSRHSRRGADPAKGEEKVYRGICCRLTSVHSVWTVRPREAAAFELRVSFFTREILILFSKAERGSTQEM